MVSAKHQRDQQHQLLQLAAEADHMGQASNHAKRRYINRDHLMGHNRIIEDYFCSNPVYPPDTFRRRFRMEQHLFIHIHDAVTAHDPYFQQTPSAALLPGLSSLQKITVAMRMLAYGESSDMFDEYIRIGETTGTESLKRFCKAVVEVFGPEYLRRPNVDDIERLLAIGEERGFPGMLGSIDCMHWRWKNCPTAWAGQYTGHCHEPTLILEAVASRDLWIWHAFFGMPGSHNDINVIDRSDVFSDLAQGRVPPARYSVNGKTYDVGYYLGDGIYPNWSTIVKTISQPRGEKNKYFAKQQESARKDVERAFGVLQARFAIVRGPVRYFDKEDLKYIMIACIIIHNMIVEDERDMYKAVEKGKYYAIEESIALNNLPPTMSHDPNNSLFASFMGAHRSIRDKSAHFRLKENLIEHLWARRGMMD